MTNIKNYDKDDFLEMIRDWQADNSPEYDDLCVNAPEYDDGKWTVTARDEKTLYLLTDDGTGNIIINYLSAI